MGEVLGAMVEEFAQAWVRHHENASKLAANIDGVRHMLALLAHHARQELTLAVEQGFDPDPALRVIALLRECGEQVERNVSVKLVFQNLVAQWAERDVALAY
jgi:hypothetical protein